MNPESVTMAAISSRLSHIETNLDKVSMDNDSTSMSTQIIIDKLNEDHLSLKGDIQITIENCRILNEQNNLLLSENTSYKNEIHNLTNNVQ